MKTIVALLFSAALFMSCSEENTNSSTENNGSEQTANATTPSSDKETEVEITFASGMLKGTHRFKTDRSNAMSQINVGFSDNVSNLSASGLISEDGEFRLVLTRPFQGEAAVGTYPAKEYTSDCGIFIITPVETEKHGFTKIYGSYENCTKTDITASGPWEEGSIYNRRGVVAHFSDKSRLEIQYDEAPEKVETSDITVTIKARESRLKK